MPCFDHFGLLAPFYDRFARVLPPERLIELMKVPTGGRLLDAGGGTGRVAQHFRGRIESVVVVDVSRKMLQQAQNKKGLRVALASSEWLPFPDGVFERVIMVDAFHHVYDQLQTAQELWRVLKPGGRLVIEEPDIRTPLVKIVALVEKLALMRSHFLSPAKIASLFSFPEARTEFVQEGFNAWICVDKPIKSQ